MKPLFVFAIVVCALLFLPQPGLAQSTPASPAPAASPPASPAAPQTLTLAEAQAIAIRNRPSVLAAQYIAQQAGAVTSEARSAYFPQVFDNATGADAESNSRITAGGLNNPIIYNRFADGVEVTQLVSDFGRTRSLVKSANLEAKAQQQNAAATREDVLLQVDEAYFRVLEAQAVLKVSQQDVTARRLVTNQVTTLAKNQLKSSLDVSFANVNLAQSELFLTQAESNLQSAFADLSLALGYSDERSFDLQEEPMPSQLTASLTDVVALAFQQRPELASSRLHYESAREYARAEAELWNPTLSGVAVAGITPVRESPLTGNYAAAGFNLNIPIFDGRLYSARHREAQFAADAANQEVNELADQIARDVRVAYNDATTAFQKLSLTDQLRQQADLALQLAQARYNLGLSSIVELSEAQLNQTQAEVAQAQAKYQFQIAMDSLNYQIGQLH
ncbi:MAG: TolC family protein [Candidatus Acidiferrales bacterium]